MMWNRPMETLPREQIKQLQLQRLQQTVERVYHNVPAYRQKMQERHLTPQDIRSLEDLRRLPFTTKQDLRDAYPYGLFAAPMKDIVRVHASSGTTGNATVVGYTRSDLNHWSELMARTLTIAGASPESVIQIAYGYGLFTGGLGVHYGAEKVGATVVPISGGNTKRQIKLMQDFGTTILACTPSYALFLAETIQEMQIPREQLQLKAGVFGAEPWTEEMRKELEYRLQIMAIDIYGLSEVMGPGVSTDCHVRQGLHIFEDHFIPEIIDPITEEPLPPGEPGELVFTSLTKEGFPVIRYRTRDISVLDDTPCACGRTHVRMSKIRGRTDDMVIIRGVNVFPSQIESVLLQLGLTEPHYLLVIDRVGTMDTLEVRVEVSEKMFSDKVANLEQVERTIQRELESLLGVSSRVRLVEPKSIERSEGKAKRVIDNRRL
ncbi:phenylacetate--CoA ligase family protein [Heliophilum fasciatum]|uniref:Phenylacetate-coenzyme A ligase n=1 Tax=Heliophilum fasciatum TaxID=35700 RepID=A0A4R2REU8_9FIRM|nr:phenylacetate--CoA ligase [Heliophilum fasciatum]MCW2278919.1 phenylacetate-CoA ligase [Heliophilum fasciatum]TCP62052.1 phenylacetate-CoA ligase [Heliophilum fasciatum]